MTIRAIALCAAFAAVLVPACAIQAEGIEEEVGTAEDSLVDLNALNMNALNMNALNMNALNMNALNMNALGSQSLDAIQDPGADGALARQLLKYTVSCALSSSQSFSFTWTDSSNVSHAETYWGSVGLATGWATAPLDEAGQEWVSACLLSRVNWYETSVLISMRGSAGSLSEISVSEAATHAHREGAFWGNLYADPPTAYACHHAPNIAYSRAQMRDCATGHLNADSTVSQCGVLQILGSCDSTCDAPTAAAQYHPHCESSPTDGGTDRVVTVYLK